MSNELSQLSRRFCSVWLEREIDEISDACTNQCEGCAMFERCMKCRILLDGIKKLVEDIKWLDETPYTKIEW